jgi:cobalt/nickel transport system permease protein
MHMGNTLLCPLVSGVLWAVSGTAVVVSARALMRARHRKEEQALSTPHTRTSARTQATLMGIMGAFVFAVQMINFTVPGTGSSGHFVGGILLSLLLGPAAGFLTIASVITVQAVFFADGGLLALGANIFNMGFIPSFVVYPLVLAPLVSTAAPGSFRRRIMVVFSAILALQIGALGVVFETTMSGIAELPLSGFTLEMLPIHLAIGVVEGLLTLAMLEFVEQAEPKGFAHRPTGYVMSQRTLIMLGTLAFIAGGVLSWFASTHPDGLEWSIARLTGQPEIAAKADKVQDIAAAIQKKTTILPNYGFPAEHSASTENVESDWGVPNAGTTVSGVFGGLLTLLMAGGLGWLFQRRDYATPS